MASSLNKVLLMGNITRDIELRHTPGNQAVATVGMAMNRRWRTPEGEQREDVTFVDCEAWGKTAEMIHQYFAKGRPIMIEGRLKLDTWQDKESGQNRSKLKVVIENFYFVDSKGGGGGEGGDRSGGWAPRQAPAPQRQPAAAPARPVPEPMGEDDIPF
jgi:single stranded DNA-binding protein (ssb)